MRNPFTTVAATTVLVLAAAPLPANPLRWASRGDIPPHPPGPGRSGPVNATGTLG